MICGLMNCLHYIAEPNITFKETIARNIELNKGPHLVFTLILKYFCFKFGYNPDIARLCMFLA